MTEENIDRRPIATRQSGWAGATSRWLDDKGVTPNGISKASMVFALLAGAAFWLSVNAVGGQRVFLLVMAALMVQGRLLCNLFDGMVAVEGGKGEKDGPFWNEFPDRVADILILTGAGLGCGQLAWGLAASVAAVLTAYVRELGRANGAPNDFCGPMAKQHRMALVTGAALLAVFEPLWGGRHIMLPIALMVITVGAGVTALRRGGRQITALHSE